MITDLQLEPINLRTASQIHDKHYSSEFQFPNFLDGTYLNKFSVVDKNNNTITAGGVRLIPEIILITDKDAPVLDRKDALIVALDFMICDARSLNLEHLHVFVQDEAWKNRLLRTGFRPAKGECLVIGTGR